MIGRLYLNGTDMIEKYIGKGGLVPHLVGLIGLSLLLFLAFVALLCFMYLIQGMGTIVIAILS